MAKFRKEVDLKQHEVFIAQESMRRERQRDFSDPWLTCVVCSYQMKQSYAVENNVQKCPNCGTDKPASVSNLAYDPKFANRPTPSLQEALDTEKANKELLRRPHNAV